MDYDELDDLSYDFAEEFEKLNVDYIKEVGKHIKQMGKTSALQLTTELLVASKIASNFRKKLNAKCLQLSKKLDTTYNSILSKEYAGLSQEYIVGLGQQTPIDKNKQLLKYVDSMKRKTNDALYNISNTTVIDRSYVYRVDQANLQVAMGYSNYESATRNIIKDYCNGARVVYASGATRRLDSAARMNVLDGMRTLSQGVREIAGQQFGADGYEISSHALCAPDHLDIEGQQYTLSEFESVNGSLDRQIGTCNCKHTYFPIIIGISKPAYSYSELQEMKNLATQQITIDGVSRTRYEWSQQQRMLETGMRKVKEQIIVAKAAENKALEKQSREKLQTLKSRYNYISSSSGLTPKPKRASVPGFR